MRIDKVHPLEGIPRHHWKWCGMNLKKKKIKPEEIIVEHASGEFVLYDENGNLEAFSGLESRTLDTA